LDLAKLTATVKKAALLALADGTVFDGFGFGANSISEGELVFNTSMFGYQESLTDPSYAGQILVATYPLIGNYGISKDAWESKKVHVAGYAVRELCETPSHYLSIKTLDKYLQENDVPGICDLDTRSIVRKIRNFGVIPSCLQVADSRDAIDSQKLISRAKALDYSKIDFVKKVSPKEVQEYGSGKKAVVLIDCGAKENIVRELLARNLKVVRVPAFTSEKQIRSYSPAGIMVSNGPGDPALLGEIAHTLRSLFDIPIFGICLGHQILAHAIGGSTYKLKFGHRGANHPVLEKKTGKVAITSQNHGYAVDEKGIPEDFEITHINLNDNTVEGLAHKKLPIFSIQYHPEACPGPHDSKYFFERFVKCLK